ncbi:hypothetical protein PIB30_056492 [Stylosanthes scabra]|uniref:Uncharacterized protein n=1 Tax=Stylosanthes scabra TaxID=79078 RepID=A0ABU6ULF2_9FABA|nr:hypothetical protein [Stylosanthes scabra]
MENKYFLCVIEEMDRLWFQQIILFSKPSAKPAPKPEKEKHVLITESLSSLSSIFSLSPLPDVGSETSTNESLSSEKQASSESIPDEALPGGSTINKNKKERMKVLSNRIRSHSSSPSSQHRHHRRFIRKHAATTTFGGGSNKLEKSMSCRTLRELELDEVKGFMDLGFIFKKETLSPWMMSVVPGLQRLGLLQDQNVEEVKQHTQHQQLDENGEKEESDDEEEDEKRVNNIMRPYLSEAWLIKRPDSPLLTLKIPKTCSASNMKKHLRFWAKTVASEIHQ